MKRVIRINSKETILETPFVGKKSVSFNYEGRKYNFEYQIRGEKIYLNSSDRWEELVISEGEYGDEWQCAMRGLILHLELGPKSHQAAGANLEGSLVSPMPGKVLKYLVQEGQNVELGQPVAIIEAMKMEHTLRSPVQGKVEKIIFSNGAQVKDGQQLLFIKEFCE